MKSQLRDVCAQRNAGISSQPTWAKVSLRPADTFPQRPTNRAQTRTPPAKEPRVIIQPTSLAALTWLGAAAGASSEGWRIGNVLSARPLGVNEQGLLVLQVGALTVETEAPGTKLPPQFQVRVLSVGAQPQLEILGLSSQPDSTVHQALRERLPQQNGYAPLLATVGALSQWSVAKQLPA